MATQLSGHYYYKNGEGGHSTAIGYESRSNRVLRVEFTTGDIGATSININIEEGCIETQGGVDLTKIPFYVTTSPDSHANANEADGYAVTGYITGSSGNAYTGTADIVLKANTTYYIWFFPSNRTYGWSYWHRNTSWCKSYYELYGTAKFALTIGAVSGLSISVNRTSSPAGLDTGMIANGAEIYKSDRLKITFTPDINYAVQTRTVNGVTFTSGNTHTVSGDVYVAATAQVLASEVGASDANIGSQSIIAITKYNKEYCHSLQYHFNGISGYITDSGGESQIEVRFSNELVSFKIPDEFYHQIPESKTGICTIVCRTYDNHLSQTQLGESTSCNITVTASEQLCKPSVTGSVIDINEITRALTGDERMLIRYKSVAQCTIHSTPKNASKIVSQSVNDADLTGNTRIIAAVDTNEFVFKAMDSRGYSHTETIRPDVVMYIALTCNPVLYRPTPTGNKIMLAVSGNVYRGSFGQFSNTLRLQYRYREAGGLYGIWMDVDTALLTVGVSSYRTTSDIELQSYPETDEEGDIITDENGNVIYPGFDYNVDYEFQIKATDGANGYILSTVDKYIVVNRGIPVFDWGENDFNVNVQLMLKNVNILNIMHPIGSVYMHSNSELPDGISNIGTWESIAIGIPEVYAWKRIE